MIVKNIMWAKYKQRTENGNTETYIFGYHSVIKQLAVFRKWDFFLL